MFEDRELEQCFRAWTEAQERDWEVRRALRFVASLFAAQIGFVLCLLFPHFSLFPEHRGSRRTGRRRRLADRADGAARLVRVTTPQRLRAAVRKRRSAFH